MPGWRMGYCYFMDKYGLMDEVREGMMKQFRARICANVPCQAAAKASLQGPQDYIVDLNNKLKERAEFTYKRLNEIDRISTRKAKGAFRPSGHQVEDRQGLRARPHRPGGGCRRARFGIRPRVRKRTLQDDHAAAHGSAGRGLRQDRALHQAQHRLRIHPTAVPYRGRFFVLPGSAFSFRSALNNEESD